MLFKNKRTGEVVEFISRDNEITGKTGGNDRVNYNSYKPAMKYTTADDWEANYEPLGDGEFMPVLRNVGN